MLTKIRINIRQYKRRDSKRYVFNVRKVANGLLVIAGTSVFATIKGIVNLHRNTAHWDEFIVGWDYVWIAVCSY